jgi:hypothetical protein
MSVLLLRPYLGNAAGTVVEFPASTEASLIAQNIAQTALTSASTPGNFTTNTPSGTAAIAIGAGNVVITNPLINANSIVLAYVAQAAADTTLTSIVRVVPAAGSVTLYGNANATAATLVDWAIMPSWPTQSL